MADWDPALYRRFEDERTRPARDLLERVPLAAPRVVYDLGCGPGNSTELLAARWPDARVIGIDTSEAMLASARERLPACTFERADVGAWTPPAPPDLLYANATLQWLPDHETLFPRLFAQLAPGGVLAVQMPDNLEEPSHRAMREVAALPPFAASSAAASGARARILSPDGYYDLLAADAESVDVWRTAYQHPMTSVAAIVEWLRSTGLRPFLEALAPAPRADYLAAYERRLDAAYPRRADGRRLLAFPRLFVVAVRRS